jgi:aerotolerance regulator-like protein
MLWTNPAALLAIAAVAAPILIHLFVRRRAETLPFPTLRFLRPTRLASLRRHVIDDLPLLAVRCAIVAAAVAAVAGPLVTTAARRDAWNRRIVRAVVFDAREREPAPVEQRRAALARAQAGAFRTGSFSESTLRDGVERAAAWLDGAPPARREIVVSSTFAIGWFAPADLARVPADVGIRLERSGGLPPARTIAFGRLVTASGAIDRALTLAGRSTSVQERSPEGMVSPPWAVDAIAPAAAKPAVDAAMAAVRAQRVWAPAAGRRARLIVLDDGAPAAPPIDAGALHADAVRRPWMADAIASLVRDTDLQAAARRVARGIVDRRFAPGGAAGAPSSSLAPASPPPWLTVARSADGTPLVVAAAADDALVVATGAPATAVVTPILIRGVANALADIPDLQRDEIVPIPDDDLRAWSRPPALPETTRLRNVDEDDRRWLWIAVLALLAIETWMRRASPHSAADEGEAQRVA